MNLKDLVCLSPVSVYFFEMDGIFVGTYYDKAESITGKAHIEIDSKLTNNQKITTLIHEIGHAFCDAKGCKCMKNSDHTEREIHTNIFVLRQLIKHKQKEILREEIHHIEQVAAGAAFHEYYINAADHIMKIKLWQKCLDYIGE